MAFAQFVESTEREILNFRQGDCDEKTFLERAKPHLSQLLSADPTWLPEEYKQPSPSSYQQFLLFLHPSELFSVVSFVWGKGQKTPIHDHGTWGMIGQYQGSESETPFGWNDQKTWGTIGPPAVAKVGDVAGVKVEDVHRVENVYDGVSISIHVYGSDIGAQVRSTYNEKTGQKTQFISGYSPGPPPLLLSSPPSSLSLSPSLSSPLPSFPPKTIHQLLFNVIGKYCPSSSSSSSLPLPSSLSSPSSSISFLDVREKAAHQMGHPLFAVCLPFSLFSSSSLSLSRLSSVFSSSFSSVVVVMDQGGGDVRAEKSARILIEMGFKNVFIMEGGMREWENQSLEVFTGCGVPSKAFGEHIAETENTPMLSAKTVEKLRKDPKMKEKMIILDSRPYKEYNNMCIPDGVFCGGGELVYKYPSLVPPHKIVVVNCAGRTRSIIGTQSLVNAGFGGGEGEKEREGEKEGEGEVVGGVYACRNGTMGWCLEGLEVERGAERRCGEGGRGEDLEEKMEAVKKKYGIKTCSWEDVMKWEKEKEKEGREGLYVFDVRLPEEYEKEHIKNTISAPGGQLVQATDEYLPLLGGRIILVEGGEGETGKGGVRAIMTASWLVQMRIGEVWVVEGGVEGEREVGEGGRKEEGEEVGEYITSTALSLWIGSSSSTSSSSSSSSSSSPNFIILDCSLSTKYAEKHIPGSIWVSRSSLSLSSLSPPLSSQPAPPAPLLSVSLCDPFEELRDFYVLVDSEGGNRSKNIAKELREYLISRFGGEKKEIKTKILILRGGIPASFPVTNSSALFSSTPEDIGYRPYEHPGAPKKLMQDYLDWEFELCEKVRKDGCAGWIR